MSNGNRELEKKAILPGVLETAAVAGGTHLAQNAALNSLLATKQIGKILEKRIMHPGGKSSALIEGISNAAVPELGILEGEAVHAYKNIANMGYKERVLAINALKGNWARLAKSEQGRKVLSNIVTRYSPLLGSAVKKMNPEEIAELEKIYKKNMLGKNIIDTTERLSKYKNIPEKYQLAAKRRIAAEAIGNLGIGSVEWVGAGFNGLKRLAATDVNKLRNSALGQSKAGQEAVNKIQKAQESIRKKFVDNPLEYTSENVLSGDPKQERLDAVKRLWHTIFINGAVGSARDLDASLISKARELRPELDTPFKRAANFIRKKRLAEKAKKRKRRLERIKGLFSRKKPQENQ